MSEAKASPKAPKANFSHPTKSHEEFQLHQLESRKKSLQHKLDNRIKTFPKDNQQGSQDLTERRLADVNEQIRKLKKS